MATVEEAKRLLTIESRSSGIEETTAKLNAMSTAHEGVAVASQKSEKATQSLQSRLNSIQRQYDAVYRAEQALARVERDLANAQGQGLITNQRRLELLSLAAEKHGLATAAINREISATERLANVQRAQAAANQNLRGVGPVNTANIAAQFQDIGVTAAMGMNPLQIALQQGTQLSAVLGPMGAAGAVRSLGAAFVSLVNPVSLITLGLVGLTAAAIQYFMSTEDGADKADVALQKQQELIAGVAKRWGDALPALKAYNDEFERSRDIEEAIRAGRAMATRQYDELRGTTGGAASLFATTGGIADMAADLADLRQQLAGIADDTQMARLNEEFRQLQEAITNSTASAQDARDVQSVLLDLAEATGIPIIGDYADQFGTLADQIGKAAAEAGKFREEAALLKLNESLPPLNGLNVFRSTPFQTEEEIMYQRGERARLAEEGRLGGIGIPTPTPRPNDIERLDATPNAQDYLRTQRESLEMLRTEIGLVGQSEAARSRQIAVLQVEQEIRRRGIDLYGVEAQEMRANAAMQVELSQRLAAMKKQEIEGAQASKKIYEDVYGFANDQLQKLIDGTFTWRDALKSLIPVLLNILNTLATGNGGTSIGGFLNNLSDLFAGRGIGATNAGTAFREAGGGLLGMLGGGSGLVAANSNVAASGSMAAYQQAIKAIESLGSGGYSAIGPTHPKYGRALGAYQVMEANVGPWSKAALGRSVSAGEFLANPSIQDSVFNHRFGSYVDKYGPSGAASMWFTGRPSAPNATDVLGTSGAGYVEKFNAQLAKLGGTADMATKGLGSFAGGLGGLAQQLSSIAGGSGGGWAGGLMNLFGGAGGALSHMMSISPLATKFILGGGVGLFAEGGVSDRPAIFGEAGAEAAVPLSRGRYIPVEMKGQPRMSGPTGVKVDVGVSVDGEGNLRAYVKNVVSTDAKQIARGEAAGILSNYDYAQRQGGSAATDQRYGALKAGRRN